MKKIQISLAAASLLVCGMAFAYTSQQESSAFYVGVQPGYANTHYTKEWLIGDASNTTIGSVKSSGFTGRFHVGFDFNKNFALEAGVMFLPKIKFNNVSISGSQGIDLSFNQSLIDICAKANMPMKHNIDLYSKVGFAAVVRDGIQASSGGQTVQSDYQDRNIVPAFGVGMDYGINEHVFADLAYMRYFSKNDLEAIDFVGFGMVYRF
jgi:opacity protein-like surface antigen